MAAYLYAVDRGEDGTQVAGFFTDDGIFEGVGEVLAFLGHHRDQDGWGAGTGQRRGTPAWIPKA